MRRSSEGITVPELEEPTGSRSNETARQGRGSRIKRPLSKTGAIHNDYR